MVPVLNEIEGVKVVMPQVKKEWIDEVLVVDGNSTDGTREYCQEHGYRVIVQKRAGGMGAYWDGFLVAQGDAFLFFSPDGNCVLEKIQELVLKMEEGYDMVIASRYKKPAKSYDDSWLSAFANTFFSRLINVLFGGRYTDALGMFRIFRKDLLDKLDLTETTGLAFNRYHTGLYELYLSMRCARYGLKVTEIPGDEPPNIGRKGSRAHPGLTKYYNGALFFYHVLKEYFSKKRNI